MHALYESGIKNIYFVPLVVKNASFDRKQIQRLLIHENWVELHADNKSVQKHTFQKICGVPDFNRNKGQEYHALRHLKKIAAINSSLVSNMSLFL